MRTLSHIALCATMAAAAPALAADVGISISVGDPGFYGQIDIGNVPRPYLLYRQPVIVQPAPIGVVPGPIYLRVPPGHAKNWHRYCARYRACGRPVYFVRDHWYNTVYALRYRREDLDGFNRADPHGRGAKKWHRAERDDRRGRRED